MKALSAGPDHSRATRGRGFASFGKTGRPALSLLALFAVTVCVAAAEVYRAPDPTPTPEEVLLLELINRFRANPSAEADFIAPKSGEAPVRIPPDVDLEMFRRETKALRPSPPLVFNLRVLDAARKHSFYMIKNGMTHNEQQGREGFTGVGPQDRMQAAGYPATACAENCFAEARDPLYSHIGFIVDWGPGGAGGMQAGRGHRANMHNPKFVEAGIAALPHGGRFSVTHNFGARKSGGRLVGGVVYVDKNGNSFYDIGEGLGGVAIKTSDGKAATVTWGSGGYALELPGKGAVALVAEHGGRRHEMKFDAGADNIKFDWILAPDSFTKLAEDYIRKLESVGDDEKDAERRRRAAIDLHYNLRDVYVDAELREKIAGLTQSVAAEVDGAMAAMRAALDKDDRNEVGALSRNAQKQFRQTELENWFKDAEIYLATKESLDKFLTKVKATAKSANALAKEIDKAVASLEKTEKRMKSGEFKTKLRALAAACEAAAK